MGIEAWVAALSATEVPVLARTLRDIGGLRQREDEVTPREISAVVLHDPLLTLRVLRYIESRRRPEQPADITTIEHALMMLGASPFFRTCERLTTVESRLSGKPGAMPGIMRALSRTHHAAVYARGWAISRHDVESDEVIVATLLHDLAEILLWYFAPAAALEIEHTLQTEPGLRSADAQQRVLGFKLHDLQRALCSAWKLPALLRDLMDDTKAQIQRVKNVTLAVALARHSAQGWDDPALPDDYEAIAGFLKIPLPDACERVARLAFSAAAGTDRYGAAGTASLLPAPVAFNEQDAPRGVANALTRTQEKLLGRLLAALPDCRCAGSHSGLVVEAAHHIASAAVHLLHDELGLPRVMFAAAGAPDGSKLRALAVSGVDSASLQNFTVGDDEPDLFSNLLANGRKIWVNAANREKLLPLLTDALTSQIGNGEFVVAAVQPGEGPVLGLFYADRGPDSGGIDPATVTAFNCVVQFLAACIGRLNDTAKVGVPSSAAAIPAFRVSQDRAGSTR